MIPRLISIINYHPESIQPSIIKHSQIAFSQIIGGPERRGKTAKEEKEDMRGGGCDVACCELMISIYILVRDGDQVLHVFDSQEEKHPSGEQGYRVLMGLVRFPREDKAAPRMLIVKKECPPEYDAFMSCLDNNPGKPEKCLTLRQEMFECGKAGFKKANSDPGYTY